MSVCNVHSLVTFLYFNIFSTFTDPNCFWCRHILMKGCRHDLKLEILPNWSPKVFGEKVLLRSSLKKDCSSFLLVLECRCQNETIKRNLY